MCIVNLMRGKQPIELVGEQPIKCLHNMALIQKYLSKPKGRFYCTYVDFLRAFDSIPHAHLWYRLVENGIHGKLLHVLQYMYYQLTFCIKTPQGLSE